MTRAPLRTGKAPTPSRPRVLFPYTGDSVGGSHISSLLLAQGLRAAGYEVVLGLHEGTGPLADYLRRAGEAWIPLPQVTAPRMRAPWRQWLRRRAACARLAPVLRAEGIEIVHSHDMRNHRIWNAATMTGAARHVWHQRTPATGRHMADYGLRAAAFLTVSEFTRSTLTPALRPHARVIYNPFVPQEQAGPEWRAKLAAELGLAPGTRIVGYVANFSERKRPEAFVRIAARIAAQSPAPVAFCMFGDPREPFLSRVRAAASATGLTDRLHVMGQRFPFGPDMAALDVLVAPAVGEALGRTLIEAALAGIPVVASDDGGNAEIVEDGRTGFLVPAADLDAFATAALRLLADAALAARICAAARASAQARFSLDSHLAQIEDVYRGVMERAPR